MRHFISLLFVLVICCFARGQKLKAFPVVLKNVVDNNPFHLLQTRTYRSDSVGFRGIPAELQAYQMKELPLTPKGPSLLIFYGITKEAKLLVLFDANFDRDFTGEQRFFFDQLGAYDREQEKAVLDTTGAVEVLLPHAPPVYLKPNPFNCCFNYNDSLERKWHLNIQSAYHREGQFEVEAKEFKIALSGSLSPFFRAERTTYFLIPAGEPFKKQSDSHMPYAFKRSVFANGHELVFDSLSKFGDTAWVLYKGYSSNNKGNRVGLFAQNIKAKTLKNKTFDLQKLKGNYVLLDFWGTWCRPCIALLPELRKLHQQYRSKGLVLVSFANDTKNSYSKLLKMTKSHQMNWINVFDNQQQNPSIADAYEVECFPTSILISPEGKIIFRSCGEDDFGKLRMILAETIK